MSAQALRYLLECNGECEHLDYKEMLHLSIDRDTASFGRDVVGMKNVGGGYIVVGVKDKTWEPVGLQESFPEDTKRLRDVVKKATGLDLNVDVVKHKLPVFGEQREFALILIRASAKRQKLRTPSVCKGSFRPQETWGIRDGDIYFRRGDSTVRITSEELESLLLDLMEREDESAVAQEQGEPSPFWVETGLYRLLPREFERFIGRAQLLQVTQKAIETDPRIWIVNLFGPGGVGKSALVNWLAYHYYETRKFEAILQLSAKDTQLTSSGINRLRPTLYSLENLLDNILMLFGFDDFIQESLDIRKEIATTLLSEHRLLLILDNMETVRDGRIMEFVRSLPPANQAKVVLTSRQRTHGWEQPIAVMELSFAEVQEFLQIRTEELKVGPIGDFDTFAKQVHEASGGLPLAIQWMLGHYSVTGDLGAIVSHVRDYDSPLLEFSFRNSWTVLSLDARTALAVLSIFDEPPTIHLWATALDWAAERVERAVAELVAVTFVLEHSEPRTGQQTYIALPITLAFARNELAKMNELEVAARTRYQRYVQEMELVAAETERYSGMFERYDVERATEKQAVILARKAESQAEASQYEEAERLYEQALAIDPRSVYVLVSYGQLKLKMRQVGEAIRLMEAAASRCTKNSGFFVYHNLSKVYDEVRDRDQVEQCLRKALEYKPDASRIRHQLGMVVSRLGRYNEAVQIFEDLIQRELNRRPEPSDTLLYAYKTKIITLRKAGRLTEARATLDNARRELQRWPYFVDKLDQLDEAFNFDTYAK
ncbi:MAG TPA: tetratricopeptide repeat protein [Herpetosiphonaceae bacterium]